MHGPGMFLNSAGMRTEGIWENGNLVKVTSTQYPNQDVYVGDFSANGNKREGYGVMTYHAESNKPSCTYKGVRSDCNIIVFI